MGLKFLHLSDIHFKGMKGKEYLDMDKDIQNELEIDLGELVQKIGNIDAILIGGDIAFSGKETEYDEADNWIKIICAIGRCSMENVLTVPGNHDVERSKIGAMLEGAQKHFKETKTRPQIDTMLSKYLQTEDDKAILMKPFSNYNTFAQKFGSVANANVLYWEKKFPLNEYTVQIRGVNSAIASNANDDEHKAKLVLCQHQSLISRQAGVIHIVMCHHPPSWLYDGDDAQTDFLARASVHLFGHKHEFRTTTVENSLILAAGAMQPSRNENKWEPRYNIIELDALKVEENLKLKVKLWVRKWDKEKRKFRAHNTEEGELFHMYTLDCGKVTVGTGTIIAAKSKNEVGVQPDEQEDIELIDVKMPSPKRKLAYKFLGLPYHKKVKVAIELNLVEDSDKELNEIQKSQTYFQRAEMKGILKDLWDKVFEVGEFEIEPNPF